MVETVRQLHQLDNFGGRLGERDGALLDLVVLARVLGVAQRIAHVGLDEFLVVVGALVVLEDVMAWQILVIPKTKVFLLIAKKYLSSVQVQTE